MPEANPFVFTVCQAGAEWALKDEVAQRWPGLRFAFSRPGFVTFKVLEGSVEEHLASLGGSAFARTHGSSLEKVTANERDALAQQFWASVARTAENERFEHLHVWQRDRFPTGEHGFEPWPTPLVEEVSAALIKHRPNQESPAPAINQIARARQHVLDCMIIEPDQWWIGSHRVESVPQRWPGGVPKLVPADDMISRAYLKISEALLWSRLPAKAGDAFVEIGCSPGGSCQALLERGFKVMGVDPAPVDPRLLGMPNFVHQQKRGADVKRRDFRPFLWLTCDVNVAPRYTLDMVEDIVTHESAKIRGMLLTLKLLEPEMYGEIGRYVARVQGWGYEHVRVRQLAFNRQEVCLLALQRKAMLRRG